MKFPHLRFEVMDAFDLEAVQALSPTGTFDKICIDIGGIAELQPVMSVAGLYFRTFRKAVLIIKNKYLKTFLDSAQLFVPPNEHSMRQMRPKPRTKEGRQEQQLQSQSLQEQQQQQQQQEHDEKQEQEEQQLARQLHQQQLEQPPKQQDGSAHIKQPALEGGQCERQPEANCNCTDCCCICVKVVGTAGSSSLKA